MSAGLRVRRRWQQWLLRLTVALTTACSDPCTQFYVWPHLGLAKYNRGERM
jgi:hypothetical protein